MEHKSDSSTAASWPPKFSLEQESILKLLTGDRFYSDPSAALREAILNAIDAIQRRTPDEANFDPSLVVEFDRASLILTVSDNGIGMNREEVTGLFARVGASAASREVNKRSVGEFGIGVISYFMAADEFVLQTFDGQDSPIGLVFRKELLGGGAASEVPSDRKTRGTTLQLRLRDAETFELLLQKFPYWCRDVDGLKAVVAPGNPLPQGGASHPEDVIEVDLPPWILRSHVAPVSQPGWDAMTGASRIAVLYRGVFVQEFEVRGLWGIEGSIDVDPKHFKPRLNREGFIEGDFQREVEQFLRAAHPRVLAAMPERLKQAADAGRLDKWTEKRWANLWLSVPRQPEYAAANLVWDSFFRTRPAFEIAFGNRWKAASLEDLVLRDEPIFVAPLADEKTDEVVTSAVRLLRNSGRLVIRGIPKEKSWLRFAGASFASTAELIMQVFGNELPRVVHVTRVAQSILDEVEVVAPLFTGPPSVNLVRLGADNPPALRLAKGLVINIENPHGLAIVEGAIRENSGSSALVSMALHHAYDQLSQIAAVVKEQSHPEILSPVRRRFILRCLKQKS